MFAATSPYNREAEARRRLAGIRVQGGLDLEFAARAGTTTLRRRIERDGYKVRTPRRRDRLEVAIINTGGGIAAGDHVAVNAALGPGANATLTTPAAERIYGAAEGAASARYDVSLSLDHAASLHWLPQETILFNRARLARSFSADLPANAELLIAEAVVFGRMASGETSIEGAFRDRWRIRRDGRLVFADTVNLTGALSATLAETAVAGGASALATVLLVAPDAEDRLARLRATLAPLSGNRDVSFAASAWNGLLLLRALGARGASLRPVLETALPPLARAGLPRVWNC